MSQNRDWMYKRHLPNGNLNPDFLAGIEDFIRVAIANPGFMCGNKIRCPCTYCENITYKDLDTLKYHIAHNGFVSDYKIWRFQGETSVPIAEDKNSDSAEASNREAQQPSDVLSDAHRELWPGCKNHSQLSCAARLMSWKAEHNISEESFDEMLALLKDMAPKDNLVPSNFSDTKKLLRGVGFPIKKNE